MKVLFYRYGNICEPDIISQFTALGIEVSSIDEEIENKKITDERRIDLIDKCLLSDSFIFVFSVNFFPAISELCKIYNLKYVCWTVDSPLPEMYSKAITNDTNRIFVFDKAQYEALSLLTNNVYHLPLATNVSRWDSVNSGITSEDVRNFSSDISFVGSLYTNNDPLGENVITACKIGNELDRIYKNSVLAEGKNEIEKYMTPQIVSALKLEKPECFKGFENAIMNIDNFIAANLLVGMHFSSLTRIRSLRALGEFFAVDLYTRSDASKLSDVKGINIKPGVATLTEMPKVFRLSKINLNMTIYPIKKGLPLRIWDVCGCGGFLLTNYQEELTDYFVPGVDLECYSNIDELIDKCRYYLEHDDIRANIAVNGYEKVKNYHSYINRMPAMFEKILL